LKEQSEVPGNRQETLRIKPRRTGRKGRRGWFVCPLWNATDSRWDSVWTSPRWSDGL